MSVDISGLDKDQLLLALWKRATVASFYNVVPQLAPQFDLYTAQSQVKNGYADYICGRPIKVQIYDSDVVSSVAYDRENGIGAFEDVVDSLR